MYSKVKVLKRAKITIHNSVLHNTCGTFRYDVPTNTVSALKEGG